MRRAPLHDDALVVVGAPAGAVELDRRVEVLGDRLGRDAADLQQRGAPDQRAGAAPEGGVVAVLAGADRGEEDRLLVAPEVVVLDGVVVGEVVRALHERDARIVEVADERLERVGQRHVVGVEHEHELARGACERVVDVAGLRVRVVRARQVAARSHGSRERGDLRAATVVEHVGRVRVVQQRAAGERRFEHGERLVVGADVDVDRAPRRGRRPRGRANVPGEPGEHHEVPAAVGLGEQQRRPQHRV